MYRYVQEPQLLPLLAIDSMRRQMHLKVKIYTQFVEPILLLIIIATYGLRLLQLCVYGGNNILHHTYMYFEIGNL